MFIYMVLDEKSLHIWRKMNFFLLYTIYNIIIKLCYSGVVHLALPGKGRLFLRRGRHPWDIEIFRLCGFTQSMQSAEWVFRHQIPNRCLTSFDNEDEIIFCRTFSKCQRCHTHLILFGTRMERISQFMYAVKIQCFQYSRSSRFKHEVHVNLMQLKYEIIVFFLIPDIDELLYKYYKYI